MTNTINQQEINQILWRACANFRGVPPKSNDANLGFEVMLRTRMVAPS